MSKEHRVDPQAQVGLLAGPSGFPLEVHLFEGNTAETTTLLPVLRAFQERHGVSGMVVVADAGIVSASNLNAIEDAGFSFIIGSRITKAVARATCLGERGFALLNQRWRTLQHITSSPSKSATSPAPHSSSPISSTATSHEIR